MTCEERLASNRRSYAKHRATYAARARARRITDGEYLRKQQAESQMRCRRQRRRDAVEAYGGKCKCCGEATYEFLGIDHVNNDGAEHRKEKGVRGSGLYLWLKRHGYPPGFQVLCHNCNLAKGFYGQCPHSQKA